MSNIQWMFARVGMGRRLGAAGLALGGALLVASCNQPALPCGPANGLYAVKFDLVEGTGACAMLKGDNMTLHPYANIGPNMAPDYKFMPVAMRSELIANTVVDYEGPDTPDLSATDLSSVGKVSSAEPQADGFCQVAGLSPAKVTLAAVAADPIMMIEAKPATSIQQDWSDFKIYVTARNNGTQFTGTMKYTQDGCTATYKARGLFPSVDCEGTITGTDGKPTGSGKPDDTLCSPCADPTVGRAVGSGLSPDVQTVCDPDTLHCVPVNDTPSLLATPIKCM
jgi:hypothetical protein